MGMKHMIYCDGKKCGNSVSHRLWFNEQDLVVYAKGGGWKYQDGAKWLCPECQEKEAEVKTEKPKCDTCKWGIPTYMAPSCISPNLENTKVADWECWEAKLCKDCKLWDETCSDVTVDAETCEDWELKTSKSKEPEHDKDCCNCFWNLANNGIDCKYFNKDNYRLIANGKCDHWQPIGPKEADVVVMAEYQENKWEIIPEIVNIFASGWGLSGDLVCDVEHFAHIHNIDISRSEGVDLFLTDGRIWLATSEIHGPDHIGEVVLKKGRK